MAVSDKRIYIDGPHYDVNGSTFTAKDDKHNVELKSVSGFEFQNSEKRILHILALVANVIMAGFLTFCILSNPGLTSDLITVPVLVLGYASVIAFEMHALLKNKTARFIMVCVYSFTAVVFARLFAGCCFDLMDQGNMSWIPTAVAFVLAIILYICFDCSRKKFLVINCKNGDVAVEVHPFKKEEVEEFCTELNQTIGK